jgi:hypothetical protein
VLPRDHALLAAALAAPLARRGWDLPSLIIFVSAAVLIDVDHYLGYVLETGDVSFERAYRFHRGHYQRPKGPPWTWRFRLGMPGLGFERYRSFHAVPVLVLLFVLSLKWRLLLPVALGFLLHRAQDEVWGRIDSCDATARSAPPN